MAWNYHDDDLPAAGADTQVDIGGIPAGVKKVLLEHYRPLSAVGSVAGMVGSGGAVGGAIFGLVAGSLLGRGFGYETLFLIVGIFHIIGFLAILFVGGTLQPLKVPELSSKASPL